MPEISLKEYLARLNSLLSLNADDEVIHHSRHILQYFPKNVTAYRLLGRALVMNGRWDEGREALRRVLSVIPDDFIAHLGLSEANEHLNRADEAIWHLERAFEQRPNDKEIINALRNLYRQHRNVANLKVQLTSSAVARQYLNTGAYTQAIDTLRSTLARMNERLDLKLLLAQVLWQQGSQEEAAEIALEVLGVLPDCLEANRIMALLWLGVNRPSDAQRYVNRLEAVDPYLAVELAQGYSPEDDAFKLDELDYVSSSQSELASGRPDWLQEISATPVLAVEEEPEAPPETWTDWASAMLAGRKPAEPKTAAPDQPTSSRFAAMAQREEPGGTGLTDFFGNVGEGDSDELSALFAATPPDQEDPLAWMNRAGVEMVDEGDEEPDFESLLGAEEDAPLPEISDDPLAWFSGAGDDLILENEQPAPALQNADDEDSMEWMRASVDEVSDNLPETAEESGASFDWLEDHELLDEALNLEGLGDAAIPDDSIAGVSDVAILEDETMDAEPAVPGPRRGLTAILQESNFDWANKQSETVGSDSDLDEWLKQFGTPEPTPSVTDSPDWLQELNPPETSGEAQLPTDVGEPDSQFAVAEAEEGFAWMSDERADKPEQSQNKGANWLSDHVPQSASGDEFAWTTDEPLAGDEPEAEAADIPDWMSELKPEAGQNEPAPDSDDEFAWLGEAADAEEPAAGVPDWLADVQPGQAASEPEPSLEAPSLSDFPWMAEETEPEAEPDLVAGEMPDWFSELDQTPAETQPAAFAPVETQEAALAGEMPDWLSELEHEDVASDSEAIAEPSLSDFPWMADETSAVAEHTPLAAESELNWLTEDAELGDQGEPELVAGDVPDWLSELAPEGSAGEPDMVAGESLPVDDTVPWTSETPEAVAGDVPDWLAELQPEASAPAPQMAAASAEDEFAWLTEESLAGAEEQAVSESEPEWLAELETELEPEAELPVAPAEPISVADFPWMAEEEQPEIEAEMAVTAESEPDWLAELETELEPEPQTEKTDTQPVEISDFPWMTAETEPEEEAAAAEVSPDWLTEFEPEQASGVGNEDVVPDWLKEEEAKPAASWMSEPAEAAYDEELEPVAEVTGDEFDDGDEFDENEFPMVAEEGDEFLEPTPAQNAPDWLNAMVPGLDVDYEAAAGEATEEEIEEPVTESPEREYAWVTEMVEAEMAATERPHFVFSRPPLWMELPGYGLSGNGVDDDLPDWPSDDADADVPEWLR